MDTKSYVYTPESKFANRAAYAAATLEEFYKIAEYLNQLLAIAASNGVNIVAITHSTKEQPTHIQAFYRVNPNGKRESVMFVNSEINLLELEPFLTKNGFNVVAARIGSEGNAEIRVRI